MTAKHVRESPVPPSARAGVPVPLALDRVVLACLAKRPEERPARAVFVADELAAIEVDPWSEEQAASWWQANLPALAS
jgi:hypothetical protein